jgi:CheY-like chemotaxis protein
MKSILVIDDIIEMRENITEILQLAPYAVVQAANGKEGIERARQSRPDLILCDVMMPELDGFGVLHILRKDPDLADVPFIFLTAKVEQADFRFGMNLGANDYLTKPFDDLTLLNAVALRLDKAEHGQLGTQTNSAGLDKLRRVILGEEENYQSLSEYYPTTQLNRKHRIFTPGNRPTALYFVCQGKIKLFKTDTAGNEYITDVYGPGDFVGYVALLEETAYDDTAELIDEALICTVPKADFLSLIYQDQVVANRFNQTLAGDVADHRERLLKLAYQSVRKRVAEALLLYQRKFYTHPADSNPADNPAYAVQTSVDSNTSAAMTLSRENWSHLVGASTETVIRILSDLRTEGLIDITGSQITLLDIEKLTHLKR